MKLFSVKKAAILPILMLLLCQSCGAPNSQRLEIIKFNGLEEIMTRKTDKVEVINFWATWCAPCIKELPYFEELNTSQGENYQVTLVSLDFADEFEKKVKSFVKKRGLQSDIVLLDEIDYNAWIDKVDPSWSGAIPATLIIDHNSGKRKFVEKELEEGELQELINSVIN